jgi:hypothetical protein
MNGVGQLRMLQMLDYSMHLEAPFVKWYTKHTRHCCKIFCNNPMDFFYVGMRQKIVITLLFAGTIVGIFIIIYQASQSVIEVVTLKGRCW